MTHTGGLLPRSSSVAYGIFPPLPPKNTTFSFAAPTGLDADSEARGPQPDQGQDSRGYFDRPAQARADMIYERGVGARRGRAEEEGEVWLVATNPMIARETSTYVLMDTHRGSIYTPPITMTLLDARSIPVSPQVHVTRCLRRCMILKRELHAEFHILMSVVR